MNGRVAAVTGATGFLGRHIVDALQRDGWRVRALARGAAPDWPGEAPEVVRGDVGDADALARLCRGADAVIHAAGLVRARRDDDFFEVNARGAGLTAAAARREAPEAAFVLVSSLAAREPQLSAYARSKREGEDAVQTVWDGRAQVARPCAVYGPGDRATLPLFRAVLRSPVLPAPALAGRLTLVHAADCARAIAKMAARPEACRLAALTDDRIDGYSWTEILDTVARAAHRTPLRLPLPPRLLEVAGRVGDFARALGGAPIITSGKMRELLHSDWSVTRDERLRLSTPSLTLAEGFASTLAGLVARRHQK